MAKHITYDSEARRALERGFDLLTEAVAVTLGPKGRNVVLEKKFGAPQIVNDGMTIAKEIELENHAENTAVALLRQTAAKTNDVAEDGTTTAVVLAHAICPPKCGLDRRDYDYDRVHRGRKTGAKAQNSSQCGNGGRRLRLLAI